MDERTLTRRDAIRTAAFAGVLLPLLGSTRAYAAAEAPASLASPTNRLTLGLATYSLRKMDVDAAIKALAELQIDSISVFRVHVPILLGTPDTCAEMANKFYAAGLNIRSTGVVTLRKSESEMRKAFECGKAAKLSMMTASYVTPPDRDTLLLTERFVKVYDIRLAFHNHGPEDSIFPSPYDVWNTVQPYDERMGLCVDVGHSARAGVDPAEAILKCSSRVYDVHIKDTTAPAGEKKDQPVIVGKGRLDIRGIMAALLKINFKGQVGLEYEVDSPNPVPGIAQSFGYMRGVLDSLVPRFPVA